MHGGETLGGPVWFFAVAVVVVAVALAIYTVVESVRPRRAEAAKRLPEPLWTYTAGQGLFLALLALVQVAPLPPIASAIAVFLVPLALVQSFAFLLRVVFPRPESGGE